MVFDTLKSVEELQEAGIPENQAKAQVRVFQRIIESDLATKRDIAGKEMLQQEMRELEYRLTIKTGLMLVASTGVILGTTQYLLLSSS